MDRSVLPLVTVLNGVFEAEAAPTRLEVVLHACVHGWMEGHLAAPGHAVSGGASEDMPAPPFPPRESDQLRAIDGEPFDGALMAQGDGTHRLPVKAKLRKAIGKEAGDTVHVCIDERIG
jgi:Domain of unknown function (DUF1905)